MRACEPDRSSTVERDGSGSATTSTATASPGPARPDYLWVAEEGWEIDHFLFDNPELKRTPYAWLSDFVGMLPMPDGGAAEAALTADVNAEHVERIRRFSRLRDRSIFVGYAEDVVTASLGSGLPTAREFTEERYTCTGYVTGFDPPADRHALRAELGYRADEQVCLVAVPDGVEVRGYVPDLHRPLSACRAG
jgi:hypothetical protein